MKKLFNLSFHFVFFILSILSLQYINQIPSKYLPVVELLPFLLFFLSLLLGFKFNRSLVIYSATLFFISYLFFWLAIPLSKSQYLLSLNSLSIFLAINIALISFYCERGIFTLIGLSRLSIIIILLVIPAWFISSMQTDYVHFINQTIFPNLEIKLVFFKQPALLAILLSIIIISTSYLTKANPFRSAILVSFALVLYSLSLSTKQGLLAHAILFNFALLLPLITLISESYNMAFIDDLTDLPGRRALNEAMNKLGGTYVLAMLDVDHFKKFNDTYGHDAGDDVLQLLGGRLKQVTGGGKPFRYGGEEFTIVFSGSTLAEVKEHLEDLRESVANKKFTLRKQERRKKQSSAKAAKQRQVSVTISIGYAEQTEHAKSPAAVLKASDKALYRAKKKGRNCISK